MDWERYGWSRKEKRLFRLPSNELIQVSLVCELNEDNTKKVNTVYVKNLSPADIFYTIVGKGVDDQPSVLKGWNRELVHVGSDRGEEVLALLSSPGITCWKTYTMCNFIEYTELFLERIIQPMPPVVSPYQSPANRSPAKLNAHVRFTVPKVDQEPEDESDQKLGESTELETANATVMMQALKAKERQLEGEKKSAEISEEPHTPARKSFFMRLVNRFF